MQNNLPPCQTGDERDWAYDALDEDGVEYLADTTGTNPKPECDLTKKCSADAAPDTNIYDFEEPAQRRIKELDRQRAEMVAKRRNPTNPIMRVLNAVVPYGGLLSSGFTLASSSVGTGIVALPSLFHITGLAMAIVYLVVVGLLTVYSFRVLAISGRRTGLRNYEQISLLLLGRGADYFIAFCMWLLSFGAEVSYIISLGDIMRGFLDNSSSTPAFLKEKTGHRLMVSGFWLFCMLPLCLPREINSLRHFSVVAVFLVLFFVVCMIAHCAQNGLKHPEKRGELTYFQSGNNAIRGLSVFMFAFINQFNMYEVYAELYKPSVHRLTAGAGFGVFLSFILYFIAGVFGYLDFGSSVTDSVLRMYNPIADPLMGVCFAGLMLKLCVGYGMHMIPVRDAFYHAIGTNVQRVSWLMNACVCVFMAVLSLITGMFIPRVNTVFGLVGGFSGGFIAFIFPSLMYMYSGNWSLRTVGYVDYIGTYVLLTVGVLGVVFGTASAIYGEIAGE